jgi:hypothetical protein
MPSSSSLPLLVVVVVAAGLITLTHAYPDYYNCNGDTWTPGLAFTDMPLTTQKLSAPGVDDCLLQIAGNPSTYEPCQEYTVTVTPNGIWGQKLWVSGGVLETGISGVSAQTSVCQYKRTKASGVQNYKWQAPANSQTVKFTALCGKYNDRVIARVGPSLTMNSTATPLTKCAAVATGSSTVSVSSCAMITAMVTFVAGVLSW